jgi:prophage lp2 protein 6
MDLEQFTKQLKEIGKRVIKLKDNITTEEATKTSFIMPFFQILGYDIFNPLEFVPEYTADVGIKKGEKVDYAIIIDDAPAILIEAKSINEKLEKHDSQLFRYFATTSAKFGILTNGIEYRFYTDLDENNKMDSVPFFTIDITKIKDLQIAELAKFHKENYDIDNISSTASELKYLNILKSFLTEQLDKPSESFVKYILSEIYDGTKTKMVVDKFTPLIAKGFTQLVGEKVNEKLSAALNTPVAVDVTPSVEVSDKNSDEASDIVTTPEELEAYTTVKLLLKNVVDPTRVFYRDNRSYFNILLDDNIRKWIVRIYINNRIRLVLNDEFRTQLEVDSPLDITEHAEALVEIVNKFLQ